MEMDNNPIRGPEITYVPWTVADMHLAEAWRQDMIDDILNRPIVRQQPFIISDFANERRDTMPATETPAIRLDELTYNEGNIGNETRELRDELIEGYIRRNALAPDRMTVAEYASLGQEERYMVNSRPVVIRMTGHPNFGLFNNVEFIDEPAAPAIEVPPLVAAEPSQAAAQIPAGAPAFWPAPLTNTQKIAKLKKKYGDQLAKIIVLYPEAPDVRGLVVAKSGIWADPAEILPEKLADFLIAKLPAPKPGPPPTAKHTLQIEWNREFYGSATWRRTDAYEAELEITTARLTEALESNNGDIDEAMAEIREELQNLALESGTQSDRGETTYDDHEDDSDNPDDDDIDFTNLRQILERIANGDPEHDPRLDELDYSPYITEDSLRHVRSVIPTPWRLTFAQFSALGRSRRGLVEGVPMGQNPGTSAATNDWRIVEITDPPQTETPHHTLAGLEYNHFFVDPGVDNTWPTHRMTVEQFSGLGPSCRGRGDGERYYANCEWQWGNVQFIDLPTPTPPDDGLPDWLRGVRLYHPGTRFTGNSIVQDRPRAMTRAEFIAVGANWNEAEHPGHDWPIARDNDGILYYGGGPGPWQRVIITDLPTEMAPADVDWLAGVEWFVAHAPDFGRSFIADQGATLLRMTQGQFLAIAEERMDGEPNIWRDEDGNLYAYRGDSETGSWHPVQIVTDIRQSDIDAGIAPQPAMAFHIGNPVLLPWENLTVEVTIPVNEDDQEEVDEELEEDDDELDEEPDEEEEA